VSNRFDPVLASLAETLAVRVSGTGRPLLVALDGPVAAGKTTLAHALAAMLSYRGVAATVVSADGFLWPASDLQARGMMARKGAPDTFDRAAMAGFLAQLKQGLAPSAPVYAHNLYDVSPSLRQPTAGAQALIFDGVNVLQPDLAPLYDVRLYLEAADARGAFIRRFAQTPFTSVRAQALAPWRPADGDPQAWAAAVWAAINCPNLKQHIAKGREAADIIVYKDANHALSLET
jgi:type I pantothenate kinase